MPMIRSNYKINTSQQNQKKGNVSDLKRTHSTYDPQKVKKLAMTNNNNNRSSIASYGSESKFNVSFKLARKKDGSAASYKQDGERFDSKETLKLLSDDEYTVTMEISPPMELLYVKFAGIENTFKQMNDPEQENKQVYQFSWSTRGIEPTLSRHRADVHCSMKFKNFKELDFNLQVKFYEMEQIKHAVWGTKLNAVILNCVAGRGTYQSYVESNRFI